MSSTDLSRRNFLARFGLGAAGTVVLLSGGGRALASEASRAAGGSPVPVPGESGKLAYFGRMFPQLPPFRPDADPDTSIANLATLSDAMLQPGGVFDTTHGALYTYFGQFIDHDVTLDLQPQPTADFSFSGTGPRAALLDPNGKVVYDFESKKLDLSQIYGGGPTLSPQLYAEDGLHFLVPKNSNGVVDLPRNADGTAILVEHRNDENQILSQLHVAFLLFHNAVVDTLGITHFAKAQRTVIHYYQWAVLHDFMPLFFGQATIDAMLAGRHRVYDPGADVTRPIMPIEFAVAAYRFGHSIVRNAYAPNPVISPNSDSRNNLFAGLNGALGGQGGAGVPGKSAGDLHGGYPLTLDHQIDWRQYHEDLFDPSLVATLGLAFQPLKQPGADGLHMIGQSLFGVVPGAPPAGNEAGLPIGALPGDVQPTGATSLQYRDFVRAFRYQMPSGQDVAAAYGLTPIPPTTVIPPSVAPGFTAGTPLFFYVLYEAFVNNQNSPSVNDFDNTLTNNNFTQVQLGPAGARICTDVLLRLIQLDPHGILAPGSRFTPAAPIATTPGKFGIADLLRFAGVVPSGMDPAPALGQNAGPQP